MSRAVLRRLEYELGELQETRTNGLSLLELRRRYTDDGEPSLPGFFRFAELLGVRLTPQQAEGARAVFRSRQVLIQGGNGVGKDHLTALLALYVAFPLGGLAILSGPTIRQVREILIKREIGKLWKTAEGTLPGERYEQALRIPGRPEGGILAFTAVDAEGFVGHHARYLFIGLTEAQGLDSDIFQAAQRCQPWRLLAVCNPTSPATKAYALSRSRSWESLRWSCLDHPNVRTGVEEIPGAVTREWVDLVREEHGEGSRFWTVAVEARFPEESESPLFSLEKWEEAMVRGRQEKIPPDPLVILGVDVARGGDDQSAVAIRQGSLLRGLQRWSEPDTQVNAERIAGLCRRLIHRESLGVEAVVIDEVGDGGGVMDKFRRLAVDLRWRQAVRLETTRPKLVERRVEPLGFKSSRSAPQRERFTNLRAQGYHHVGVEFEEGRAAIAPGIDADLVDALREELLHHSRIHQADERILVGSKDEIKRTLGRSPDLSDAYMMSYLPDLQKSIRRRGWFT